MVSFARPAISDLGLGLSLGLGLGKWLRSRCNCRLGRLSRYKAKRQSMSACIQAFFCKESREFERILGTVLEITMWSSFTLLFKASHFLTRKLLRHINGGSVNLMMFRRERSRIWVVWGRRSDWIFRLWLARCTLWSMDRKTFLKSLYTIWQPIYEKKSRCCIFSWC